MSESVLEDREYSGPIASRRRLLLGRQVVNIVGELDQDDQAWTRIDFDDGLSVRICDATPWVIVHPLPQ